MQIFFLNWKTKKEKKREQSWKLDLILQNMNSEFRTESRGPKSEVLHRNVYGNLTLTIFSFGTPLFSFRHLKVNKSTKDENAQEDIGRKWKVITKLYSLDTLLNVTTKSWVTHLCIFLAVLTFDHQKWCSQRSNLSRLCAFEKAELYTHSNQTKSWPSKSS